MKDNDKFEDMIRKDLDVRAGDRTYNRMWEIILDAHEQSKQKPSAARLTIARRTIMKSPIVKFAVAAAIIAVVGLGVFEFIGTGAKSGVVWAEVAKKVEASRGVIYRRMYTMSNKPDGDGYSINYESPPHFRIDSYKGGKVTRSTYRDSDARTVVYVVHEGKRYIRDKMPEENGQKNQSLADPKQFVQMFMSCEYKKLGQKTIEGVLCEGLETTDPTFGEASFKVDSLVARLWVSVETGYPVLLEGEVVGNNGQLQIKGKGILDQFQWDVELDPSIFEPNIPPDYEQI
jgi:hypothetical protein